MFKIDGLEEYVRREEFLEKLNIPKDSNINFQLLAQGEYNINYLFTHPITKEKLILRINTASQMNLSNQIEYEYKALLALEESTRTPKVLYVDGSKKHIDYDEKIHFLLLHPHREVLVVILELLGRGVEVGVEHRVVICDGFLKGIAGIGIKSGSVVRILLVHKALLLEVSFVLTIAVDECNLQTLV